MHTPSPIFAYHEKPTLLDFPGKWAALLFTYSYTTTAGASLSLSNLLMGSGPTFSLVLNEQYQGKLLNLQLNSVIAPKLSLAFKNEDFLIPEFDFQASADPAGNIGNIWLSE